VYNAAEPKTIELAFENRTLHRRLSEVISDAGFRVFEPSNDNFELADLLLLDLGYSVFHERMETYREALLPVVFSGFEHDRDGHDDVVWLEKPFEPDDLVDACCGVLGLTVQFEEDSVKVDGTITCEVPPGGTEVSAETDTDRDVTTSNEFDGPIEELTIDDDDSMILDVEDLSPVYSGVEFLDFVLDRVVTDEDVAAERRGSNGRFTPVIPFAAQSMQGVEDEDDGDTDAGVFPGPVIESGAYGMLPNDTRVMEMISQSANLLADAWLRIGMSVQTRARRDEIERLVCAVFTGGLDAGLQAVKRLPESRGLVGGLDAMPFVDVLRTIRDRRLQGRLEVSGRGEAYSIYVRGAYLDGIEHLTSSDEVEVLDELLRGAFIDVGEHANLLDKVRCGAFSVPLDQVLVQEGIVSVAELHEVHRRRIYGVVRRICQLRSGDYSFLEIRGQSAQTWPVKPLRIGVDELLLEILRESSIETGGSEATARTRLVPDSILAAAVGEEFTTGERNVLEMFRDGRAVGEAKNYLASQGVDDASRIIHRLKRLDILRRSDDSAHPDLPADERDTNEKPELGGLLDANLVELKSLVDLGIEAYDESDPFPGGNTE
jgi:hypothetical protein